MLRVPVMLALILCNFVLQTTLIPELAIFGVTPDTAIIFIAGYAILRGEVEGAIFGLATGLVQDLHGGMYIGLYAMLGLIIGYVCGKPFRDYMKENFLLPLFVVLGAVLAHQLMLFVSSFMFMGQLNLLYYLRAIILPKIVYTAVLTIPLYSLLHVINSGVESFEGKRRHMFTEDETP